MGQPHVKETEQLPYTIYKHQLKMDKRLEHKTGNHKTPGRKHKW